MRVVCLMLAVGVLAAQNPNYTLTGTLTASAGDGTACTLSKVPGIVPTVTVSCTPGNGGPLATLNLTEKSGTSGSALFAVGDVSCTVGMNATSAAVTVGSLGSLSSSSAAYACSVNDRSSPTGAIQGQTVVPVQTMVWP